ncbi:DUF6463 family protein [Spirosoma arcticum]
MNRFYRYTGLIFMLTGVLHVVTGVVAFKHQFNAMIATRSVASARESVDHQLAFWFTFVGLLMGPTGYLMDWVGRRKGMVLPSAFGYVLTGLWLVGVVLMPTSGFWLVLLQSIYLTSYSR